jgi:cyclohexyl-isocyanide hydratase
VLRGWLGAEVDHVATTDGPVITDSGSSRGLRRRSRNAAIVVVVGTGRPHLMVHDDNFVQWIREVAPAARWMVSVCAGAGLLGAAGVVRGRRATTHRAYRDELAVWGSTS